MSRHGAMTTRKPRLHRQLAPQHSTVPLREGEGWEGGEGAGFSRQLSRGHGFEPPQVLVDGAQTAICLGAEGKQRY